MGHISVDIPAVYALWIPVKGSGKRVECHELTFNPQAEIGICAGQSGVTREST